jgi:hypothetical protein
MKQRDATLFARSINKAIECGPTDMGYLVKQITKTDWLPVRTRPSREG